MSTEHAVDRIRTIIHSALRSGEITAMDDHELNILWFNADYSDSTSFLIRRLQVEMACKKVIQVERHRSVVPLRQGPRRLVGLPTH